jgi:hypothetical protein
MSELHMTKIRSILAIWHRRSVENPPYPEQEFCRSTSPDARMNLLLRFETESGPRTIVAPGVPLPVASEIVQEMARAGHFADYLDQLAPLQMSEWMKRCNAEKARPNQYGIVVGLQELRQSGSQHPRG